MKDKKMDRIVGDYGAGHRESRLAGGDDPEMFIEVASGVRVALAAEDIHQGVSYQPGTAACGFDCHVDPKYGFVPEADCPVHDRNAPFTNARDAMMSDEHAEAKRMMRALLKEHAEKEEREINRKILFGDDVPDGDFIERDPDRTETIISVAAMQIRAGSLFSEMIFGLIAGYRVEMDRSVHPAEFHITTWR